MTLDDFFYDFILANLFRARASTWRSRERESSIDDAIRLFQALRHAFGKSPIRFVCVSYASRHLWDFFFRYFRVRMAQSLRGKGGSYARVQVAGCHRWFAVKLLSAFALF